MKEELIPIGKMAAINHVTIATLRLYDEKGLLHPRYVDPNTGYRYYDVHQNARLDLIAYMKELGMSLSEIADVLKQEDISLIENILIQKHEQLLNEIQEMKMRGYAIERAIQSIEKYRKAPTKGSLVLEFIDRRYVWGIQCKDNFYESDIKAYEKTLLEFRNALSTNEFEHIHTYNIATSISKENFMNDKYIAKDIFIFTNQDEKRKSGESRIIDSGMFACIYLDNYDDEIECAKQLKIFCELNNYQIVGDYICEVLTEFNFFDTDQRNMYLKLQIPVSFQTK